jgi:hypothetical protein
MKKTFKISFITLLLGWFPFMFLCLFGMRLNSDYRLLIVLLGFLICLISAINFTFFINDRGFWLRKDILDKEISALREAKNNMKMANNE